MSGDYLIVAVPWLVFAAGLAAIVWRLALSQARGRRRRNPVSPGKSGQPGERGTPPRVPSA